eukprot:2747938-Karenia_brevis.AAC.1
MCDMCLSEFCDTLFEEQFGPETGSYLLAGWMALHPEYGSSGSLKIPMLHRTLKGWKRLMPAMSRWPLPWPICCAMATWMAKKDKVAMSICLLL